MPEQDPGWDRYFRWPTSHFPIQFPVCRVEMSQEPGAPDRARISWEQAGSVALLSRVVTADGQVLHELRPRLAPEGQDVWTDGVDLHRDQAPEGLGLAFTWWFYVPPVERVPQHPMGVVLGDADYLLGAHTRIRVTAHARPRYRR